jgi:hypothetical protein
MLTEIEAFVRVRGKSINVEIQYVGGGTLYLITNVTPESLPLEGWDYGPTYAIRALGSSFESAWKAFRSELAEREATGGGK